MELIEKETLILVGLPVAAHWRDLWVEMPKAWRTLFSRVDEIPHRTSEALVDASLHQEGEYYKQLVGARVSRVEHLPEGMEAVEIPAQRYLHHRHEGSLADIAQTFGRMYEWAAENFIDVSDFKIDIGYTAGASETFHDLHLGLMHRIEPKNLQGR